jgi:hypothetical protein
MSQLISGLAGAGSAANTAGGFYNDAMQREIDAAGSPAAKDFARLQMAQLRPEFAQQNANVASTLAAQGLVGSGQGRALGGNVASNQSSQLAGVTAPLYQQALNQYGQINAEEPGMQNQAYNNAIQQFYTDLSMAGQAAAGIPPSGGSAGSVNPGANAAGNWEYSGAPGSITGPSSTQYYTPQPLDTSPVQSPY